MTPMSNLQKLEVLTEALAPLNKFVNGTPCDLMVYDIEGTCLAEGLLNIPGVAVARSFMSRDSVFPRHGHDETEWLIIYQGSIEVATTEAVNVYSNGAGVAVYPGQEHTVKALEDTWMVAITIPASRGYATHGT